MILIGNLKNNIPTNEYIETIVNYSYADKVALVLPLVYIYKYREILHANNIKIGAQSVDLDEDFSNRGEVNAKMLKDVGTEFVFLGHKTNKKMTSTDYIRLRKKIKSVLENNMQVVVSIGETMEEYETGKTCQAIEKQVKEIVKGLEDIITTENLIFAYEPKWAVGTGLNLSADEMKSVIINIHSMIEAYAKKSCKLLFGGSCNSQNIPKYIQNNCMVDGFAISTACLNAKQFVRILCGVKKQNNE